MSQAFNPAMLLTYFRIVLIVPFMYFLYSSTPNSKLLALITFLLASVTDTLDGQIARKLKIVTNLGKFLDPVADKLLVSAALISFVELDTINVPAWMVVLIISRDFVVSAIRMVAASEGVIISPTYFAKFKTSVQFIAIVYVLLILVIMERGLFSNYTSLLTGSVYWVMLITALLTVVSSFSYIKDFWDILKGYSV